ncbi:sigma-70 family RNA polymerase sigma factor [Parvibaculum sp.]|jgi:RNA polymerase sigma-70 factor, ECF subfamily|uniref:sigma-70 family RNA polymerase sigma factor n=1 Tax=Parvibaculum sp. TaxID=2024848 RepID=UPI000C40A43F|nr:sigma-70 family RNA polymerase sigma factor [Parvibaculum sp.]MAM94537.1 RNA polymerase subunit sigma-70 [Parvibaculum sp.]HCX68796.1 RNA polymerase subunit sigma-70 [Rhodobiaceae bacterium]|tara:strand:- start:39888 stop:40496 length:609 start_codon:yes stop_codon:yes gene_type:complete
MTNQIEITAEAEPLSDADFKKELEVLIPHLRAFARNLCGKPDMADDLAQDALLKAWAARKRYRAGTNMRAWVFVILRNQFLSQMRRSRFTGEWDESVAERTLSTPAHQDHQMQLTDLQRALMRLPAAQREALVLVGAGGFSYEEAAGICDCAVGTVKSRVARARAALDEMIDSGILPARSDSALAAGDATDAIMGEMDKLTR